MFKRQSIADLTDIKYEDIKVEIMSIFKAFSIERYLQSFCNTFILISQIFYFSKSENFESQLFVYVMSLICLRLLFSLMNFYQLLINQEINQYFINQKYYEIGELFKQSLIVCECSNIIFYFPFKFLFEFLLGIFILNKEEILTLLTLSKGITQKRISSFLNLNFFVLLMDSIAFGLGNMMLTFKMKSIINMNNVLRVVINLAFCRFVSRKYAEAYFMSGIAYANILTEVFSLIFLTVAQYIKNPYPQAWAKFNLGLFSIETFRCILSKIEIENLISFILFYYWDDFFLLIFSSISLEKDCLHICAFLFAMIIFKRLLFHIKRKDKEEIISYYHKMQSENANSSTISFNQLDYEYDSQNNSLKGDFQWMMFIKTKIIGTIAINVIIGMLYILFYFLGGFKMLNESIEGWWYIVSFFAFNALIEQCTYQAKAIREYLLKKNSLVLILIAFGVSLLSFLIVNLFFSNCLIMIIGSIYLGYYFLLYRFYPEIKNVDMRIINLELLIYSNSRCDNDVI